MGRRAHILILSLTLAAGGVGLVQEQSRDEEDSDTATVSTTGTNDLGEFIVDGEQMSLYGFSQDRDGVSFCYHRCAEEFPPLLSDGEPRADERVDATLLGTLERADGSTQVTYNGHPLYRHVEDQVPNDTFGQRQRAFRGVWYVISPDGDFKGAQQQAGESEADTGAGDLLALGKEIFGARCQVCHASAAPAMEGNRNLADARYVIATILHGAAGGAMPAWDDELDNEQVAAVASYIRTLAPNDLGAVSAEDVASIRGH